MEKKLSLVEQAKQIKQKTHAYCEITDEMIELAIAWMKDEVTGLAVGKVLYPNAKNCQPHAMNRLAIFLREGYRKGKLKIKY